MIPAPFDYVAPKSLSEALNLLSEKGEDAKLLAGGQSLLPLLKLRLAAPKLLIDLSRISGLKSIAQQGEEIVIGALATHYQVASSDLVKKKCPLLAETAGAIGDVQVRNLGTVGGSLAHADPSADWPAAMLALGAEFKIAGPNRERRVKAEEFFLGPMTTAIQANEILTEIRAPCAPRRSGGAYSKAAQQASGFAIVGVAVWLGADSKGGCEEIGIGVTGLAEKPFRARGVEAQLRGEKLTAKSLESAAAHVADGIEPLEDLHAGAAYRAHLARIYSLRALRAAAKQALGRRS
jgi:carbon-monoxide dehydrogenase medium subunit